MIYEHSNDLSVGPYHFMAYAFAPDSSSRSGSIGKDLYSVRMRIGSAYSALFLQYHPGSTVQAVIVSIEDVKNCLPAVETFFESVAQREELNTEAVRGELDRFTKEQGLMLSATTLLISDAMQEGSASFAMVRVFMAGMPPLILIEDGHFHFPVRSGIPLGINDLQMKVQPLELPLHGSLYIHTPLNGQKEELKAMHSMLPKFQSELLPEGVLLLGLSLKKAEC